MEEILRKIGQLQYEISCLELDKETLTGVTIRTDELKELVKNCSIPVVSGSFPTEKEVEEAAESFGNLYSQDPNFANGCEAGWKAGAEWMKQKHNDR